MKTAEAIIISVVSSYEKIKLYVDEQYNRAPDTIDAHNVVAASSVSKIAVLTLTYPHEGTADDVVNCSHGKQLWELSKEKYEPLWVNGGGHCNLELYPEYINHMKKFILTVGKSKASTDSSKIKKLQSDEQSKQSESKNSDASEISSNNADVSRNSLDSRLDKSKKSSKPEKSRMSVDSDERYRKTKCLIW